MRRLAEQQRQRAATVASSDNTVNGELAYQYATQCAEDIEWAIKLAEEASPGLIANAEECA